jgi:hypothetical protein
MMFSNNKKKHRSAIMKNTHKLTDTDIAKIVRRRTGGDTFSAIAKDLGANYDQARKACESYLFHLELPAKVIQKLRLIKGPVALAILKIVQEDPTLTFTDIGKQLKQNDTPFETIPHRTSIQCFLASRGCDAKKATKVEPVSLVNRKKRVVFAENHEDENEAFWDYVVWSDEVTVEACPRNRKLKMLVHCNQKVLENSN